MKRNQERMRLCREWLILCLERMRVCRGILLLIAGLIFGAVTSLAKTPLDRRAAALAVDSVMAAGCTDPIVGLWNFPEDGVEVAILPESEDFSKFVMTVADSEVANLPAGKVLAHIEVSAEPKVYGLNFDKKDWDRVLKGMKCVARLSADGEGLSIKTSGVNLRLNPLGFLTRFSRILRLSVDVPIETAPEGLLRIYPTFDNSGGSRRRPVIL